MCLEKEIFFFLLDCGCARGPMSWAQEVIIFVQSTGFTGVASSAFDLKLSASLRCILKKKTKPKNANKSHIKTQQTCELAFHVAFCERCFRKEVMFLCL